MWGTFIAASRVYGQNLPNQMSIESDGRQAAGSVLEALEDDKTAPLSQKQQTRPWETPS
jgi:hypothetical protein